MKCKMNFVIKIVKVYICAEARASFFLHLNAFILIINSRLMFDSIFSFFYLCSKLSFFHY